MWNKIEYPDKRIVRQILLSFRYFNYHASEKEITNLTTLLENEIGKTIWNLAALVVIPDEVKHFTYLREALDEEISSNFDTIYIILSIMYDPQSVQLVRDNVESGSADGIAFAIELLDLFLNQELKPKLFPLIDDIPVNEKVRQLQNPLSKRKLYPYTGFKLSAEQELQSDQSMDKSMYNTLHCIYT